MLRKANYMERNNYIPEKIVKNTMVLMIGSISSQIITAIVSLALTRLYSAAAIGTWSVFTSIVSIMGCVIALRYENAIVLPEKDEEAINVLVVSLLVMTFMVIVICCLLFMPCDLLQSFWEKQGISSVVEYLPICLLGIGLFQIFNYWCTRKRQFIVITLRNILNSVVSGVLEIVLGIFMIFGQNGAIIGSVIGTVVSGVFIAFFALLKCSKNIFANINIKAVSQSIYKYRKFPLYSTWGILLNQLSSTVATFALALYFSQETVGYYSIAQQLLTLPMTFIGNCIGQVLYSASTKAIRENKLTKLLIDIIKILVSVGVTPLLLIAVCAPQLCYVVYGSDWNIAGVYARILIPWLLMVFLISPLTVLFDAFGKQKNYMFLNIMVFIARVIVLVIGGESGNVNLTLYMYTFVGIIFLGIVGFYLLILGKCPIKRTCSMIFSTAIQVSWKYLIIPIFMLYFNPPALIYVLLCALMGIIFLLFEGRKIRKSIRSQEA